MARLTVPTVVINSAPGTTDDRSKGYDVGTFWFNYSTGNLYVLKDNSVGAAVWSAISGGGGGGGVTSVTGTAPIASSGGTTPAISLSDGGVTLAKLADLATKSLIGRKTAGSGAPEVISTSDLASMFGTPDGTKFLADDGTLKTPAGGGGSSSDLYSVLLNAPVSITTTTTLGATDFGKDHYCTGVSSDYPVTLYASVLGDANKHVGITISRACTQIITIDAGSGGLIDGQQTIKLIAGDRLILRCTAAKTWETVVKKIAPVAARYTSTAANSIPNGTPTIVDFATKDYDTHGCVTTGASWKFTAPVDGIYMVNALITAASSSAWSTGQRFDAYLNKNGTTITIEDYFVGVAAHTDRRQGRIAYQIKLAATDYIQILGYADGARTLDSASAFNNISITLIPSN